MKNREGKAVDRSVLRQEQENLHEAVQTVNKTTDQAENADNRNIALTTQKKSRKRKGRGKYALITIAVVLLLFFAVFKIYVDNDYEPFHSMETYRAMTDYEIVSSDNMIEISNADAIAKKEAVGFIIYGDERVQRECYLPLMATLADQGFCVFLPTTFGNLPFLNQEGAEYVIRSNKAIHTWYIIAHGKACPAAARYAMSHASKINGMIYLGGASYHTDLSQKDIKLLSVMGTLDSTLDAVSVRSAKKNDPDGAQYLVIEGGNHTGFADTVLMRGDTASTISTSEQIEQTVAAITAFLQAP